MEDLKIVLVGERRVGKTSLGVTYLEGSLPVYLPMLGIDNGRTIFWEGRHYITRIWDSGGGKDYELLRPLAYRGADVMLLCFSVDSKESLERIGTTYIPEVQHHCPCVPTILVACKIDLRNQSNKEETIPSYEGAAMARGLGCEYCETSAVNNNGIDECFNTAVEKAVLYKTMAKRKPNTRKCNIF